MSKKNLFRDEVYSYTLSNNISSGIVDFEEGQVYTSPEQLFLDSIAVNDASEQFNFKNVWKNQKNDVHPPLYYLILHIICSLCIGKFSIWYAASINICFAILTLYALRKLIGRFENDDALVNFCSVLFVISTGVLQGIIYLRMYVMAMFWVTLTTYLFIKAFEEKFSKRGWSLLGIVAVAGALTHYYCIVYLCITCLVFGICLITEKRWKDFMTLVSCMSLAAIFSIAVFPSMLTHIFSGYRGTEAIDNLTKKTVAERWERLKAYKNIINEEMLGNLGGGVILFVVFLIIMLVLFRKNQNDIQIHFNKRLFLKWSILGIPAIIYFLLVSISAAYVNFRYVYPIYAVVLTIFFCLAINIWKKIDAEKYLYIVLCFIGAVLTSNEWKSAKWTYLYKSEANFLDSLEKYSNINCIYVYDAGHRIAGGFLELKNYAGVVFIDQKNIGKIKTYSELIGDEFMLTVRDNIDNIIKFVKDTYPYFDCFDKIGGHDGSTTYHVYAGKDNFKTCIYSYDKQCAISADKLESGQNAELSQNGTLFWIVQKNGDCVLVAPNRQALDISNGIFKSGTNVQLYSVNNTDAQKWKMVRNDDGSCSFLAKDGNLALTNGCDGNVYLSEYRDGEKGQCWWIDDGM